MTFSRFLLAVSALVFVGCSSTPSSKSAKEGILRPPSHVLARETARGENPEVLVGVWLTVPLPPLYLRIRSQPPAHVIGAGTIDCKHENSNHSISTEMPVAEANGELVASVRPPQGLQKGMECFIGIRASAITDPGKITLLTAEQLAGP